MNMRKAIAEHCKSCIYDELDPGTWRFQTSNCTFTDCSLWPFRPLDAERSAQKKENELMAMSPTARAKEIERRNKLAAKMRGLKQEVKTNPT